jgi:hypothetical protein
MRKTLLLVALLLPLMAVASQRVQIYEECTTASG